MTGLFHHVAIASLPVTIALVAIALAAWGALAAQLDDADTTRLARTYLEPLSTWALIAIGVHLVALLLAGDAGGLGIAMALALAAGAVALRAADVPDAAEPHAPEPEPEPAPIPPTAPVAPADGSLWADADTRRPRERAALWR
jgi:hypothetical protein